jgi:hypothetical protein
MIAGLRKLGRQLELIRLYAGQALRYDTAGRASDIEDDDRMRAGVAADGLRHGVAT